MIYQSERMTLCSVMEVFHGKVNDAVICREEKGGGEEYYTVLVVKERRTAQKIICVLEGCGREKACYADLFYWHGCLCLVFDCVKERRITEFYMTVDAQACEEICTNLLAACMLSAFPFPLLYLVLQQGQIHLYKDNSIVLSCMNDLEGLDTACGESKCAMQCALLIRRLAQQKLPQKNRLRRLLEKRIPKQGYRSFQELLRDIYLAAPDTPAPGFLYRFTTVTERRQKGLLRLALWISCILAGLTLLVAASDIVWGELKVLRIFWNGFRQIGTQSLMQ